MNILFVIFLILGILSLFYYGIIISYAGVGSSFSWFWLLLGIGSILISLILLYLIRHEISIPKLLRTIIITIFIFGFGVFSLIEGTIIVHANQKADPGMDYIIILGAQVRGTRITKTLKKRLDTAVTYLKENSDTVAIVSGGKGMGEDISEAEAMKKYLIEKGISDARIKMEDKSTNTNENIRFSKDIINNPSAEVAVVTNGFHVYRATEIAKKQGISQIQGLSAPSDKRLLINYYVREFFGVLKDKLFGNM
jgi:uncharacterized SAM-binding protein YcdF (DUF218 family)